MRILVTGATGFIGTRLVPELVQAGHEVRAMTRNPARYRGPGEPVAGDVDDIGSLAAAMEGCDVVYYLIHAIGRSDVGTHDEKVAKGLGLAAAALGVQQIIYLGGLGSSDDDLSTHLQSRRDVETALGDSGTPVTVLRAALVLGEGSLSWEILKQLVDKLPVLPTGPWASTRVQPIGVADAVGYLVDLAGLEEAYDRVFDIGGPEAMTYGELLERTGAAMGKSRFVFALPLLPARLASLGIRVLTDVDAGEAATLVHSLSNDVVVQDDAITRLLPRDLLGFEDQVRAALKGA